MSSKLFLGLFSCFFLFSCGHTPHQGTSSEKRGIKTENWESGNKSSLGVKKYTLANGLRLLVVPNHQLPIFSYYTFFDVGGRYEQKGTTGATHFLEHMMFKGAKKYGPSQFDSTIEANGGSNNAFTTFDSTVYYESAPARLLETIADMEADRMQHLLLEKSSFEKERQVVLEERKLRYENSPQGLLYLRMMKEVFVGTPYAGSVIGDEEDVQNLNRDQMMDFFKKFYRPDNAIIVVVGDVEPDNVHKIIEEKFGKIAASQGLVDFKKKMDTKERYSHRAKYKRWVKVKGNAANPIFMLAFKGEKLGTKQSYIMDILASMIGVGSSSYLVQKYVQNKKPKLSSISASNYTLKNSGVFFISGELLKSQNLASLRTDLGKTFHEICHNAIHERSLQKIKNQYLVSFYQDIQTNAGIAKMIGSYEFYYGDYQFYEKELDIYNAVTLEDVQTSCKNLFLKNNSLFLSVWNKH